MLISPFFCAQSSAENMKRLKWDIGIGRTGLLGGKETSLHTRWQYG